MLLNATPIVQLRLHVTVHAAGMMAAVSKAVEYTPFAAKSIG